MASPSHWIPEDDFRLRKSIENGASLESLAKGAVKFSRRFTLSELRDRWHSLLYNPHVTSLSSSAAFDHMYSDQFLPQTHHNQQHRTPVRSQYYTACKRRRLEEMYPPSSNDDNNVINNEDIDHVVFGEHAFEGSEYFDMEFDEVDLAIIQNSFPGIDDGGGMVNQLFNDCDVSDTTTAAKALEQFLLVEDSEDPMSQQPFTSLNETTSVSHDQAATWIDPEFLPSQQEGYCHNPTSLPEWDPHPEVINGVIICTLNKESDEIPDNDDIDFTLCTQKARNPSSSSSLRKHMRPPPYPNRGSSSQSQARGNNDMFQSSGTGDNVVTEQTSCSNAFKASYTEKAASSFATTTSTSQQHYEQTFSSLMDINTPVSQDEEDNNEIESDEDLPSYSDVEAMILDMDLEPIGADRYELEASRYRNEEVAQMIMRLEQSSKSYMNRNITSHEAFAMLYGNSKHYINKPEVLLGRATGEYRVDIDLAKSGSWKKVSRRQAIIKLKKDGCFVIKNLGKFSIWINEKEAQHGEIVNLTNNSLIQIREMSFVFETNDKAVKRYLDGIHK
ncbi:Forkhead-associated [Hirschfeldia incana]|nr:Forkhead-associated [Hirschfeldia incana]